MLYKNDDDDDDDDAVNNVWSGAGDFLQRSSPGSLYQDSWPSLFIAPPGVHSGLHIDAFASNFWMALFKGKKR